MICSVVRPASAMRRAAAFGNPCAMPSYFDTGKGEVVGTHLLMAVGRRPNTDDLGLEEAGIATDKKGFIQVDNQLRTNVAGVWAIGDCNGRGAFTHTSYNDFEIVAANLLDNDPRVSDRITAYNLYIDPPLGRAGMTEAETRKTGKPALMAKMVRDCQPTPMNEKALLRPPLPQAGSSPVCRLRSAG
jgi:pyruvate/2-oxoglutarate dehydrogenase complex dihydrolipoamide dehydrogenase (E3) component